MMDMPERVGKQKRHYIVEICGELADYISLRCDHDFPSGNWRIRAYTPRQALSFVLLQYDCSPAMDMAWANYQSGRGLRIIDQEDVETARTLPRELRGMSEAAVEKAHVYTIGRDVNVYRITDKRGRKARVPGQLVFDF